MYIKVVNPRLQAEVVPGDVVQAGVIISNSETGQGAVWVKPLVYRLVCSNGMVVDDAQLGRYHVGRAADSEEDVSIFSEETKLVDDVAFIKKLQDTVDAAVEKARFLQVVDKMRNSAGIKLDIKHIPDVVKLTGASFHYRGGMRRCVAAPDRRRQYDPLWTCQCRHPIQPGCGEL